MVFTPVITQAEKRPVAPPKLPRCLDTPIAAEPFAVVVVRLGSLGLVDSAVACAQLFHVSNWASRQRALCITLRPRLLGMYLRPKPHVGCIGRSLHALLLCS